MAGAGFKTFNTGDVLTASDVNTYLMQQTVMVFADSSARSTALGANVAEGMLSYLKDTNAVEVYNGSAWVSSDDPNAIQNTIVDAKGDIITATAADTPARLAVGANGYTLVADSSQTTGLGYTAGTVQANPVLNSAFQVWQRGTSFAVSALAYTADRWQALRSGGGVTYSRQATGDTTNLPFIQYVLRMQRDSGNTSANSLYLYQSMETINSIPFAGKTITVSFYARKGANFSATSPVLKVFSGTGTDQNIYSTFTGSVSVIDSSFSPTTSLARYTFTGSVPTTSTQLALGIEFAPSGTAGAADYLDITGFQIDIGSVALPFRTYAGTIQGELAACQRYFQIQDILNASIGAGAYWNTTEAYIPYQHKVTMRNTPAITFSGTGAVNIFDAGTQRNSTACSTDSITKDITELKITTAATTAGRGVFARIATGAGSFITFSSEL